MKYSLELEGKVVGDGTSRAARFESSHTPFTSENIPIRHLYQLYRLLAHTDASKDVRDGFDCYHCAARTIASGRDMFRMKVGEHEEPVRTITPLPHCEVLMAYAEQLGSEEQVTSDLTPNCLNHKIEIKLKV